ELKGEIDKVPKQVSFLKTYVQQPEPGERSVYAIHAFRMKDCPWEEKDFKYDPNEDVDVAWWTDNPFIGKDGKEAGFFPQVRHILIHELGFKPPRKLPEDEYDGDERKIKF
ncbi:MAG: hypothetical protein AAB923_01705, partial [Patescibacteria group bacterium]